MGIKSLLAADDWRINMAENLLEVRGLQVNVEDKQILHSIDLDIKPGETHVLMGPNGAGKSTLGYALMGNPKYTITDGTILFNGEDITKLSVDKRAKAGLFLSFQNPLEVPGISLSSFLKTALEQQRGVRIKAWDFRKELKQAMALLLTINRIPQVYYGTEVLMNGTKAITDGYVRCDYPGGWTGDKHNAFTAEGRTKAENDMFNWMSRLLHWRQGNEVITKGSQTQFCTHKGIYVIARQYNGKNVMTIINGKREANELDVKRYAEIIGNAEKAIDVTTGRNVIINHNIKLRPRQAMILEF